MEKKFLFWGFHKKMFFLVFSRFSMIDFHDLLHGDTGGYKGLQGVERA